MTQQTEQRYIVTDDAILGGEPVVDGTRTPVRAIVELWQQGIAPEAIPTHLPHLTLAQVFAALSYESDHQDEINRAHRAQSYPGCADRSVGARLVTAAAPIHHALPR